jgi:hypothetical protein
MRRCGDRASSSGCATDAENRAQQQAAELDARAVVDADRWRLAAVLGCRNNEHMPQSAASILERAIRLTNIEIHAVALQRRRLANAEREDDEFLFRWWTDLQFFIVALSRLRRYASIALRVPLVALQVQSALDAFDRAVPDLAVLRNTGEHADEYAVDSDKRRLKAIDSRQLEVGAWNGQTYQWLGRRLNVDEALAAGEALFKALQEMRPVIRT